jgi:hypothetical protein
LYSGEGRNLKAIAPLGPAKKRREDELARQALILALVALGTGACATEHRTVVVAADDACTRYGFTAATVDYVRCQEQVAVARGAGRRVVVESQAQLVAESQAACEAYGLPRGTAQFDRCIQDEFAARRPG